MKEARENNFKSKSENAAKIVHNFWCIENSLKKRSVKKKKQV